MRLMIWESLSAQVEEEEGEQLGRAWMEGGNGTPDRPREGLGLCGREQPSLELLSRSYLEMDLEIQFQPEGAVDKCAPTHP